MRHAGACDPRCEVSIFMWKTRDTPPVHSQQSMLVVPIDTPRVRLLRPLTVFGTKDLPGTSTCAVVSGRL